MLNFSIPAPRIIVVPLVNLALAARWICYFGIRVLFCEPFFKAHCSRYGRDLHTGIFFHWIQGRGQLVVGDNVIIDGKCSFHFAARYAEQPTLIIGDNSGIGDGCSFVVGKKILIGRDCRIAPDVIIFDASGHPTDPAARQAGLPANQDDVRPVVIEDNVWIGRNSIVMPGVRIGCGSVVAAGSVVMTPVGPNTLVAGNPARPVRALANKTPA